MRYYVSGDITQKECVMKYGNCLIFAIGKFIRFGGYIIVRKSRTTWIPHFMWTKSITNLEIEEYKPIKPLNGKLFRWFPIHVMIFEGRVRKGTGEEV